MKIGREIMEDVAREAWEELEALHILELMEVGGASVRMKVEEKLRQDKELLEAEERMMKKIQEKRSRKNKVEALKKLWLKKNLKRDIEQMTRALDRLEIDDWDKELGQVLEILENLILENPTLPGEDVSMVEKVDTDEMKIVWNEVMDYNDVGDDEMIIDKDINITEQPEPGLYSMCTVNDEVCTTENRLCTLMETLEVDCTRMDDSPHEKVSQPETPHSKHYVRVYDRILSEHRQGAVHVSYKQHEDPPPSLHKPQTFQENLPH